MRPLYTRRCAHAMAAFATAESVTKSSARVDEHVHIGGYLAAADPEHVRARGITHILKLFADDASYPGGSHRHPGVEYLVIGAEDRPDYPLDRHFVDCLQFVQKAVRGRGQVLVHCHAGVSRSATVVLLHLMVNSGMSLSGAWGVLKTRRAAANPNPGFWRILQDIDNRAQRFRSDGRAPPRPRLDLPAPQAA